MKEKKLTKRILSLVLIACMLLAYALPTNAVSAGGVRVTQVDNSAVVNPLDGRVPVDEKEETPVYKDTDIVRVSIVLKDKSTIEAGFSTSSIASNSAAMRYRDKLAENQAAVTERISARLGEKLDVAWNLTLAANIISANVEYGQIGAIEKVSGVKEVFVENRFDPCVVDTEETADPQMGTSGSQIGSPAAWAAGYTGAGSRIAIIDTGTQTSHQSFSAEGYEYSLSLKAEAAGMTLEAYMDSLDLLDAEEIASVAGQLHVAVDPEAAYLNSKNPFAYNYVDKDYDTDHANDRAGNHGSHVAGIAAANSYIRNEDGTFSSALTSVYAQGVAPDAQLITLKVFGKNGGAYESDFMVAIEDAVILGCDSVNLSLGSNNAGPSRILNYEYQDILDGLTEAGAVVCMSGGNSSSWVENAYNLGYLYTDDVNMQTSGYPGTFTNALSVASVDNDGNTGYCVSVADRVIIYNQVVFYQWPMSVEAGEREYVFIDGYGTQEDWAAIGDALEGKVAICSRGGEPTFSKKAEYAVRAGAIATIVYNNEPGVFSMNLQDYYWLCPSVSITQEEGAFIKSVSTPVTDEEGNVLYYTGSMTIGEGVAPAPGNSEYDLMSSFSSWGVPGSLEMKPEITAPGGAIYSVDGASDGTGYTQMSGTSMASPQVAGMAASWPSTSAKRA